MGDCRWRNEATKPQQPRQVVRTRIAWRGIFSLQVQPAPLNACIALELSQIVNRPLNTLSVRAGQVVCRYTRHWANAGTCCAFGATRRPPSLVVGSAASFACKLFLPRRRISEWHLRRVANGSLRWQFTALKIPPDITCRARRSYSCEGVLRHCQYHLVGPKMRYARRLIAALIGRILESFFGQHGY